MWTIRKISTLLAADVAGHDALRKAAAHGKLNDPLRMTDGRGTQFFGPEALFLAALILALRSAGLHGAEAWGVIEVATGPTTVFGGRGRLSLTAAIEAARRGESVQFRRVIPGRSLPGEPLGQREHWWGNMIVLGAEPLPERAESVLTLNLNRIWSPVFAAIEAES